MVMGSCSGGPVGEGDDEGMDDATPLKNSNIYWSDAGSYYYVSVVNAAADETYVDRIDVSLVEGVHVSIR
jgi:hypothetical protein